MFISSIFMNDILIFVMTIDFLWTYLSEKKNKTNELQLCVINKY